MYRFLWFGELNAMLNGDNEVTNAHRTLLMAHPALQLPRQCEC